MSFITGQEYQLSSLPHLFYFFTLLMLYIPQNVN